MRGFVVCGLLAAGPAVAQEQVWSNDQAAKHLSAMDTITEVLCPFEDRFKRTECLDGLPNYSFAFAACRTAFDNAADQYACFTIATDVWTTEAMEIARPDLHPTK